jgi:hypothetical protein
MPQEGQRPAFEQPVQAPEQATEVPESGAAFEAPAPAAAEQSVAQPAPAPAPSAPAPSAAPAKDPTLRQVESVLEEGLADAYKKMNPGQQKRFSQEGDKVARRVAEMVRTAKVKAREVLDLITRWLKLIPGVNRFFLDQEAKLKTDRILALGAEEKKRQGL